LRARDRDLAREHDGDGDPAGSGDLDLFTQLTHTFSADLDITLQSPAGTVATITTDNGAGNNNTLAGTTFDDQADPDGQVPYISNPGLATDNPYANNTTATPLVPEETLAAFQGEDPNGTWTLTISDDDSTDGGTLESWRLDATTGSCPAPPSPTAAPAPTVAPPAPTAAPPAPTPGSPSLRLRIVRLSVFGPDAGARCRLTMGRIEMCRVRLRARGRVLARGVRSVAGGADRVRVPLRLTEYGQRLLDRRLGGVRARVAATDGTRTATARTRAMIAVERLTTPPGSWEPNAAELTQPGRRFIKGLRGKLIAVSSYGCEGHSAALGAASARSERALELSLARAELACDALQRFGATGKRSLVGRGGTDPIAENTTRAGRAENRRVEITLRH
jgi:subtilisin-like proprotein convertase family protein